MKTFEQCLEDKLDYIFEWGTWLGEDTISSHTVLCDNTDFQLTGTVKDGSKILFWIEGGTAIGDTAIVSNTIETAAGRKRTRRVAITIVE